MVGIFLSKKETGIETRDLGEITELVRGNEQRLLDRLMPVVRRQSISLDLRDVTRIDAAGLAAVITLYTEACKAGHRVTVSRPSRHVREILDLVGLDKILVAQQEAECGVGNLQLQESAA